MSDEQNPLDHTEIDPQGRTPEPSTGTDEEGEAALPKADVTDDTAAWVHIGDAGNPDRPPDAPGLDDHSSPSPRP